MPLGHLVDLIWRHKAGLVYLGAALIACSLLIMIGLLSDPVGMRSVMPAEAWFVVSALLAPVGDCAAGRRGGRHDGGGRAEGGRGGKRAERGRAADRPHHHADAGARGHHRRGVPGVAGQRGDVQRGGVDVRRRQGGGVCADLPARADHPVVSVAGTVLASFLRAVMRAA